MKKYLVSLYDIFYNEIMDTPVIIIKSKLFKFKQKIVFYRGEPNGGTKVPPNPPSFDIFKFLVYLYPIKLVFSN